MNTVSVRMKYKRIRLVLNDLYSLVRGWYFKFARRKAEMDSSIGNLNILADFSTNIRWRENLGDVNLNRIENMKLCCRLVNGLEIKPGEIFSLAKLIGEPTSERGFRDGPVIVKGKLVMSSGGGLCQVSTTLFNTALMANLKILEKYNHSKDLWGENRFIDLGRDAVYVYARRDLKFKNTHKSRIIVLMDVDEENLKLNCKMLSAEKLLYRVQVESKVLETITPDTRKKDGTENTGSYRNGWVVLTSRYIFLKGKRKITYRRVERYKPAVLTP